MTSTTLGAGRRAVVMPSAQVLSTIASPRRREILRLVWREERSAGDIHRAMPDATFGAGSLQLRALPEADLAPGAAGAGRRGARAHGGRCAVAPDAPRRPRRAPPRPARPTAPIPETRHMT